MERRSSALSCARATAPRSLPDGAARPAALRQWHSVAPGGDCPSTAAASTAGRASWAVDPVAVIGRHASSPTRDDHRIVVRAVDATAGLHLTTTFTLGAAMVVQVELENSGTTPYLLDGAHGHAAGARARHRAAHPHRAVGARTRARAACVAARGDHRREPAGPHVARHARSCSPEPRRSASGRARCGARTSHGAATMWSTPNAWPTAAATCSSASCSTRVRSCSTRRHVHHSRSDRRALERGLTPASWGFHRHLRARPGHPSSPVRCCSTRGRPCTSTTTSTGCGSSPPSQPRWASSATCSTTAGSARAATTRAVWVTGWCHPTCTPTASPR
jgi:hypothetical protein